MQENLAFASSFVGTYWRDDVMVKSPVDLSTIFCKFMTTTEKEIPFQCHTDRICNLLPTFCCLLCICYQAANMQATWQITQETVQTVFLQYCHWRITGTFYQQHTPNILYILNQNKKLIANWSGFFTINLSLLCKPERWPQKRWQKQFYTHL